MKTPAGIECKYFYGDYYRGRSHEECRLLGAANLKWEPGLCRTCPVPSINLANSCQFMVLHPSLERSIKTVFRPQVKVSAYCEKSEQKVKEPKIGCGICHPILLEIH